MSLKDHEAEVNEPAVFEVRVDNAYNTQIDTVQWYFNNIPIRESPEHDIRILALTKDKHTVFTLVIGEFQRAYEGTYEIQLNNKYGKSSCRCYCRAVAQGSLNREAGNQGGGASAAGPNYSQHQYQPQPPQQQQQQASRPARQTRPAHQQPNIPRNQPGLANQYNSPAGLYSQYNQAEAYNNYQNNSSSQAYDPTASSLTHQGYQPTASASNSTIDQMNNMKKVWSPRNSSVMDAINDNPMAGRGHQMPRMGKTQSQLQQFL